MHNNYEKICEVLKKDERFISNDGELLKNIIQECAVKMDEKLLQLLYSDEYTKNLFFKQIGHMVVFDKIEFNWIIDSQAFLPDSYTQFKNDIMLTDEHGKSIKNTSDVVLQFPYKDCTLEFDSTSDKENREEVFFNEKLMRNEIDVLLAPKVFSNAIKYDKTGGHNISEIKDDDNLIIKGNNLIALYSLLPRYKEKIKLMYWDILYNTDNDKVAYADSFKHSSWLTMMKNRLEVAQKLLRKDGVICIQCDDHEQAYLKVLCDEIFGRDRFINCISVKMSESSGVKMAHEKKRFPKLKEYILIYAMKGWKGFYEIDKYKQEIWDGEHNIFLENFTLEDKRKIDKILEKENQTQEDVKTINSILKNTKKISLKKKIKELAIKSEDEETWCFKNSYRIIKTAGSSSILNLLKTKDNIPEQEIACELSSTNILFFYITDFNRSVSDPRIQVLFAEDNVYKNPCDFWQDIKTTGAIAQEGGVQLSNGKKPEKILYRLIKMMTQENDIVLDAYLGSGTTAAVAHKMKRRYIGIEQLPKHYDKSIKRMNNVINGENVTAIDNLANYNGGGSFISCELAKYGEVYLNKINDANNDNDLIEIYNELQNSVFVVYRVKINELKKKNKEFSQLSIKDKKKILLSIIDKNILYINYSDIDDENYNVSDNDKEFSNSFYNKGGI